MKYAVLIDLLWAHQKNEIILDQGLTFVNLKTHPAVNLYKKLCKRDKIDNSEPYDYDTAIILNDYTEEEPSFFPSESKYSLSRHTQVLL